MYTCICICVNAKTSLRFGNWQLVSWSRSHASESIAYSALV